MLDVYQIGLKFGQPLREGALQGRLVKGRREAREVSTGRDGEGKPSFTRRAHRGVRRIAPHLREDDGHVIARSLLCLRQVVRVQLHPPHMVGQILVHQMEDSHVYPAPTNVR